MSKIQRNIRFYITLDEPYEVDVVYTVINDDYGPIIDSSEIIKVTDMSGRLVKVNNDIAREVNKELTKVDLYEDQRTT